MQKGERTRQHILEQAAQVFSLRGYFATSFSDLIEATGLEKGGIYNHFGSKDELALAVFDYSIQQVRQRSREILVNQSHTLDRLRGVAQVFRSLIDHPILAGGCPVLNTAVEADDTHPALRKRAQEAMDEWRSYIVRTVRKGIERKEIRAEVEGETLATVMLATLEGGVMMTKLYGDKKHMERAADFILQYLDTIEEAH
ncbi:MAG: TetR/AcrR family transcriptional regulator [Anaerolineae bacterium]|nr:TetR/AcrR family transcriptional regulator [Anaerolineae bacterium]